MKKQQSFMQVYIAGYLGNNDLIQLLSKDKMNTDYRQN